MLIGMGNDRFRDSIGGLFVQSCLREIAGKGNGVCHAWDYNTISHFKSVSFQDFAPPRFGQKR